MKKLSEELQKVYDFCEKQKNNLDKAANSVEDDSLRWLFSSQSTCYWGIQQFILVNFMEE